MGVTPLLAVMVTEYVPAAPDGVPPSVPVPFLLSLKVTPLGSVPVSVRDGVGAPVVVTAKLPAAPIVNVVLLALVIAGTWFTVRVKLWLAAAPTPFLAVIVSEYVPAVPDAGAPFSVAVPFPLSTNVTPLGSAPVSVRDGVGVPVVVTVKKLSGEPTKNVVLLALVMPGAVPPPPPLAGLNAAITAAPGVPPPDGVQVGLTVPEPKSTK